MTVMVCETPDELFMLRFFRSLAPRWQGEMLAALKQPDMVPALRRLMRRMRYHRQRGHLVHVIDPTTIPLPPAKRSARPSGLR